MRVPRSALFAYFVAIVAVALATVARVAIDPLVGGRVPYATYYPAVALVAFTGHLGASMFATVLSAVFATYFFVFPRLSFKLVTASDLVAAVLFLITGALVAVLTDRLQRTRERLESAARVAEEQRNQVQQERSRLQELVDSIPGVVWEFWGEPGSPSMRIGFISDYIEPMLGYKLREWRTTPNFWIQILRPQDRAEIARAAQEKFLTADGGENEFRVIDKQGRVRWVLTRFEVVKENGKPLGMRGVTFDITSRKDAERRLRLLADISGSGISGLSFQQLAAHIARRTTRIIGECSIVRVIEDDALKAVAYDHASPDALPYVRALAEAPDIVSRSPVYRDLLDRPRTIVLNDVQASAFGRFETPELAELAERFKPKSALLVPMMSRDRLFGTLALWRASGQPYSEADVKLVEAIATRAALALENTRLFESVQREAEDARKARAAAEDASRVKDEFLATLSHELRTPLNAIVGWAHMLRDPLLPEERRQSAIETIVRNAQSQEQLIADILDVQRIMAGKLRLNLRNVDLSNVVRAAAETVQPSAENKQIRLQLLLDLDLGAIWGDAERLQQVVWNLLNNAIKFTPKGGKVQVRLLRADSQYELIVEDTGPGIAHEFLPFVFERFRQADSSTTRTHKGLGLGLAIVRSLVEMHGGTITADNVAANGQTGAIFTIRLPRQVMRTPAAHDPDQPPVEADVPVWIGEAPSLHGIRVLVVEDDPDARELIGAILERCGADVVITGSAAEGMAALKKRAPHVLLSDIEMPEEDGYTLIRKVRALPESAGRIPAAALTAYASTSDRMKVLAAGFNMHVSKPVQPAELAMIVASLAGKRVAEVRT